LAECQDDSIRAVGNAAMKKEGEKTLILSPFFKIGYLLSFYCFEMIHICNKNEVLKNNYKIAEEKAIRNAHRKNILQRTHPNI